MSKQVWGLHQTLAREAVEAAAVDITALTRQYIIAELKSKGPTKDIRWNYFWGRENSEYDELDDQSPQILWSREKTDDWTLYRIEGEIFA